MAPAIFERSTDVSKCLTADTPDRPATLACQKASFPIPLGATIPTPVTTTRRASIRAPLQSGPEFTATPRASQPPDTTSRWWLPPPPVQRGGRRQAAAV